MRRRAARKSPERAQQFALRNREAEQGPSLARSLLHCMSSFLTLSSGRSWSDTDGWFGSRYSKDGWRRTRSVVLDMRRARHQEGQTQRIADGILFCARSGQNTNKKEKGRIMQGACTKYFNPQLGDASYSTCLAWAEWKLGY